MKFSLRTILMVFNTLLLLGVIVYLLIPNAHTEKTSFIDLNKVYNEFQLKKELENELSKVNNQRQAILDSLAVEIKLVSEGLRQSPKRDSRAVQLLELKKRQYLAKEQEFGESNQLLSSKYHDQVLKQLNQYVEEFGKENNYQYIYGADGSGSLMYANEIENVTEEVIAFVNHRYSGS